VLYMSTKDQLKLEIVTKVLAGSMSRQQAQAILDVSQRTLERYLRDYRHDGPTFVSHGNAMRASKSMDQLDQIGMKHQAFVRGYLEAFPPLMRDEIKHYFKEQCQHGVEKLAESFDDYGESTDPLLVSAISELMPNPLKDCLKGIF